MAVQSLSARIKYGLVGVAGKAFINTLAAFCDGELENRDIAHRVRAEGKRIIYAFWHGRLMVPLWTHRNSNVGILISQSRDGEYVARVAEKMGFHVIRGSSTRGAAESFTLLHEALADGYDVALTPDGPTGPRYEVKKGIVYLARASGAVIVPVGMAVDKYKQLASWDEFRVILPGAYVLAKYGEPIAVPERSSKQDMEVIRQELEMTLRMLTTDVESRIGEARRTKRSRERHQGEK